MSHKLSFLAVIPARYASTRFPGKPLAVINGKTMIRRVFERTSEVFEHCWVATDDSRIESEVRSFGGCVTMTSAEHRSGTDRCAEALEKIQNQSGMSFDVVVNVQGDEPFIAPEQLTLLKSLFDRPDTQLATLVKPFGEDEDIFNPNSPKAILSPDGEALWFSRSAIPYLRGHEPSAWSSVHTYYKHIGLYAYRSDVLKEITALPQSPMEKAESLEQLRWIENGYRIRAAVTHAESLGIDTPEDLDKISGLLAF